MFLIFFSLFSLSCQIDDLPPHRQLIAKLPSIRLEPEKATAFCMEINSGPVQEECLLISFGKLLPNRVTAARKICEALTERNAWECYFRLAEESRNMGDCKQTGSFSMKCKLHLFTGALSRGLHGGKTTLKLFEIPEENEAGWRAIYYQKHQYKSSIDLNDCEQETYKEICREEGIQLYKDRISRAQNLNGVPCFGRRLPDHLSPGGDKDLIAIIANAREPCR